ncbi:MAG: hypothetical protein LUF01_05125 [Bacteroides sp.]|nr:hypothetical protein [Bacteroides sp.]
MLINVRCVRLRLPQVVAASCSESRLRSMQIAYYAGGFRSTAWYCGCM